MAWPDYWVKPSAVRAYIHTGLYGNVPRPRLTWAFNYHEALAGLLELIDHMDGRYIYESVPVESVTQWFIAIAAIRVAFTRWQGIGRPSHAVSDVPGLNNDPVGTLYEIIGRCPDDLASQVLPGLTFVKDKALRTSITRDIESLDPLFLSEQWKAVTVIGGSVVEALLLDALLRPKNKSKALAEETRLVAIKTPGWKYMEQLDRWSLDKLITVASTLKLIEPEVASVCTSARQFRNLIHPGRERAKYPCDRGTALAVRGAVEQVVRSLGGKMP